jgi:uncharacterized protein
MGDLKQDLVEPGIELVETHTSWVFLGQDTVFKVKKPVDFGFLDFTTLEKRRVACEAEVRLNTRLAPHVYQGVVPVTLDGAGRHQIGGEGNVVDFTVKMVRLADAGRADLLLERGRLATGDVRELAEHLARFHEAMPTGDAIAAFGSPDAILANIRENFAQTHDTIASHLSPREANEIETKQIGFVERRRDLFEARLRAGRVRDGHGDLRLEHVYLSEGRPPTVIDCIEFNERFRYADVCADVAFLSMDFERLGRADLAEQFLAAYAQASGDYDLYLLVDFYESYRAYARGKVASILAADAGAEFGARERARKEARRAYLLALLEGREALIRPAVVAVGGVIASGKSTVAERVATMIGAPVVDADRTRKSILGVEPKARLHDAPWSGAYAPEITSRVYGELVRRARCVLSSGRPVVLDASFRSSAARDDARRLARDYGVPFYFVECRAEPGECRRRLGRRAEESHVSDGRLEIFDEFAARWDPAGEVPEAEHLIVDTEKPLETNARYLEGVLPAWPSGLTQ